MVQNINDDLDDSHDSTFPEEKAKDDREGQFEMEADVDLVQLRKLERGKITQPYRSSVLKSKKCTTW